jgi:hypothetical protein
MVIKLSTNRWKIISMLIIFFNKQKLQQFINKMNITKLSISNFLLILNYEFLSNLLVSMSCKFRLGPVRVLSDKS